MRILHNRQNADRILQITADTMLLVSQDGTCVDIDTHSDLWFLQEEKLLGKNLFDILPSHTREKLIPTFRKVLGEQKSISKNYRLDLEDGTYYFKCIMYPYDDMVLCQYRDITKRSNVKLKLERTNHELREIQKAAHIGQWRYVSSERIFYFHGYTDIICTEEEQSISIDHYLTLIVEEDRAVFNEWLENNEKQLNENCVNYRIRYEDTIHYLRIQTYNREEQADGTFYLEGYIQNVTDIQRHRNDINTLTHAIDNAKESIFAAREDGTLTFANRLFRQNHRIQDDKELNQYKIYELAGDITTPEGWRQRCLQTKTNKDADFIAYHPVPGNDEILAYTGTMYHITEDEGDSSYWSFTHDITQLELMKRELQASKEKAEMADKQKSAFLANMSHEIRTPLNAIVGFSRLIAESEDADERKAYYDIVDVNNDRLLQLINEILDLSKIESGIVEFTFAPVRLNNLCKEIHDAHIFRTPRGVELVYTPSDETLIIDSDKNRIFQVISNLIGNAFKFTTEGSISYGYRKEGERIVFCVTDTGTGIAPDKVGKVFERFMKLNSTAQGTGLGLSICKTIIERLGGEISVTSELGKGSTFSFWLPAKEVDMETENTENTEEYLDSQSAENTGNGGVKPTILIAEDTDSNYDLLFAILGKMYNLVRARDGMEAVTLFDEIKPDLVLMDIKMPNLDGLEATKIIRELSPDVPIIIQSAFAYEYDRNAAQDAGCNDFITKPIAQEKLKGIIKKNLFN